MEKKYLKFTFRRSGNKRGKMRRCIPPLNTPLIRRKVRMEVLKCFEVEP